ncbi:MAG: hypothetical protein BHW25_05330 [Faecalibacterium sp. CAG:82-related_59_9]|nr:MAG: hypothetical protein BHW25_05330 [Faecalibacterium sp. CAG:82-related_59_9]
MNAEQRSVFQGIVYYYREHTVLCRYELTMKDPVDAELLQQACDEARPLAGYFFQKVVWEKREAHLAPNDAPFRVRIGHVQPHIPEDTDDYQLACSCEGNQIFFDWFHFLADGRGGSQLMTLVLKLYCNLRYGTAFACEPLVSDPPYDIEDILARYPESQVENDMQKEVTQTSEAKPQLVRVRLDKQSLLDAALPLGVKPFSALITLFCKAGREYLGRDDLMYNYSTDARDAMGTPKALFNCVASFQRPVTVTEADTLATLVPGVEADIRHNLTKEPKLFRVAEQMAWGTRGNARALPPRTKKAASRRAGTFWVSYQGDPFVPADPDLEKYLTDFQTWVPADGASIGVECTTLHGVITICIQNKAQKPGYAAALRRAFESAGVKVLEAAELGPSPYTSPYIP